MAQPLIVGRAELLAELGLGSSATDADLGLLERIQRGVENAARRYVRHGITQPDTPYVEFHPRVDQMVGSGPELVRITGDRASLSGDVDYGNVIQLDHGWVRSISEVREDRNANFGQGGSDFPTASILTAGTDYGLELDAPGLSKTGHLVRRYSSWPNLKGTVKVTYVAGLTATELDDEYSDIKDAIIEEIALRWNRSKSVRDGAVGPVVSESMGGQVLFTYDTQSVGNGQLSKSVQRKLQPFARLGL